MAFSYVQHLAYSLKYRLIDIEYNWKEMEPITMWIDNHWDNDDEDDKHCDNDDDNDNDDNWDNDNEDDDDNLWDRS